MNMELSKLPMTYCYTYRLMHLSRLIKYYFLLKEMMVNPETHNWPMNIE